MRRHRVWLVFLALVTMGVSPAAAQQRERPAPAQPQQRTPSSYLKLTGEVTEIHSPRVFTVRERGGAQRELLVFAPRPLSRAFIGATVTIEGALRRYSDAELKRSTGLGEFDEATRQRLAGRTVLAASSIMAITQGEAADPPEAPAAPAVVEERQILRPRIEEEGPLSMRTAMLAANADVFAGRQVRLTHGRVVGVLEPGAFLVEPATSYLKAMGQRDRLLVLIGSARLRVPTEVIVGSEVTITGIARTLVGMQVTREVPWPARLETSTVERLEVRGAILATSVQTADGVELTDAAPAAAQQSRVRIR